MGKLIRENLATVVTGMVVACVLALALLLRPHATEGQLVVRVHDGEGHTFELPLAEDGSVTVETSLGTNVVEVRDGAARVIEADCPRGDCLHQKPISSPGEQLICLPHQLWAEVVEKGAPDGELDVTAASDAGDVDFVSR